MFEKLGSFHSGVVGLQYFWNVYKRNAYTSRILLETPCLTLSNV
jgi:hypothetical protein